MIKLMSLEIIVVKLSIIIGGNNYKENKIELKICWEIREITATTTKITK